MTNPRIIQTEDLRMITQADWQLLPSGFLDERYEIANYIKVALMSDQLSDPGEILPDPDSTDRRGWWADMDAQTIWRGWPIGCKCWLLMRTKIVQLAAFEGDTVNRAEMYCRMALQPLIDLKMCSAIDVQATRVDLDRIDVSIVVYRGPTPEIQLLFQDLWNELQIYQYGSPYGGSV
jgi:phage gp46-like protein